MISEFIKHEASSKQLKKVAAKTLIQKSLLDLDFYMHIKVTFLKTYNNAILVK